MRGLRKSGLCLTSLLLFVLLGFLPVLHDANAQSVIRATTIRENGGRLDWCHKLDLIAFDEEGQDGYFDVYTMAPDGSNVSCLTCDRPGLPNQHMGNPAWHPSGDYVAFVAQKPDFKGHTVLASPGWGVGNALWLITKSGEQSWCLTKESLGAVHPHFSPDGSKLLWSEMAERKKATEQDWAKGDRKKYQLAYEWATQDWVLKVADFTLRDGVPRLENTRQFRPGSQIGLREAHGISPDGKTLLFSGSPEPALKWYTPGIFAFDLETQHLKRLTDISKYWNEHAHYSPSGKHIVWISSRGFKKKPGDPRNEYWIMGADGSGKRRLTHFNGRGHPESEQKIIICGDNSWDAEGKRLGAYVIMPQMKNRRSRTFPGRTTKITVLELDKPL
jgi:Tol biopolymer transport system component